MKSSFYQTSSQSNKSYTIQCKRCQTIRIRVVVGQWKRGWTALKRSPVPHRKRDIWWICGASDGHSSKYADRPHWLLLLFIATKGDRSKYWLLQATFVLFNFFSLVDWELTWMTYFSSTVPCAFQTFIQLFPLLFTHNANNSGCIGFWAIQRYNSLF